MLTVLSKLLAVAEEQRVMEQVPRVRLFAKLPKPPTLRGIPLTVIKELMGHATIDMTERYAHLSPDTRREAVGVFDRLSAPT